MFCRIYSLLSLLLLFEKLLLVVCEPGSWRVINFYSLVSDFLELSQFLGRWHWRLEGLVFWEFVWLKIVSEKQRCSVGHGDFAASFVDGLNSSFGGV